MCTSLVHTVHQNSSLSRSPVHGISNSHTALWATWRTVLDVELSVSFAYWLQLLLWTVCAVLASGISYVVFTTSGCFDVATLGVSGQIFTRCRSGPGGCTCQWYAIFLLLEVLVSYSSIGSNSTWHRYAVRRASICIPLISTEVFQIPAWWSRRQL